jgi:hypothetical protein
VLTIVDMDANELARVEGTMELPSPDPSTPVDWDAFANLIGDLPPGVPFPSDQGEALYSISLYSISLQVEDAHLGDVAMRIRRA